MPKLGVSKSLTRSARGWPEFELGRQGELELKAARPSLLICSAAMATPPPACIHATRPAGSRLVALFVFFAQGELAARHPWLMSRWFVPFVAPKPGDAQATLLDGELALVPGALDLADAKLRGHWPRRSRNMASATA
jgi:hypothetical protein